MMRFLSALENKRWPIPQSLIQSKKYKMQPGYEEDVHVKGAQVRDVDFGEPPGSEDDDEERKDNGDDDDVYGVLEGATRAATEKSIETTTKNGRTNTLETSHNNAVHLIQKNLKDIEKSVHRLRQSLSPQKRSHQIADEGEDDRKRAATRGQLDNPEVARKRLKATTEQLSSHPTVWEDTVAIGNQAISEQKKRAQRHVKGVTNIRSKIGRSLSFDDSVDGKFCFRMKAVVDMFEFNFACWIYACY